jgi:replicative DNA helicase
VKENTLHNQDAEQAVLAAALMEESALRAARAVVAPASFYRAAHRHMFAAMLELADAGSVVDPLTLSEHLAAHDLLGAIGGKEYVGFLADALPTAANVHYHAEIVREQAALRSIVVTLDAAAADIRRPGSAPNARAMAQRLFQALLPYTLEANGDGFRHVKDFLYPLMANVEQRSAGVRGLMTGYAAIDVETNGFRPGELVIVAAAEKAGKSAIVLNFARRILRQTPPVGVGIVSAEMTGESLVERLMASEAKVNAAALQSGRLGEGDYARLARSAGDIASYPLWIDDEAEPSLADVVSRATDLKAQHPEVGLIVVDFLQLVQAREKDRTEASELKAVAYGLKGLAKRLGVVVIAPCQVNSKEVEGLKDMRPRLKDLQGSSGMRQAADFIALAYREGLYNDMAPDADVLELNFAACRRTRRFMARLEWDGPTMTIRG